MPVLIAVTQKFTEKIPSVILTTPAGMSRKCVTSLYTTQKCGTHVIKPPPEFVDNNYTVIPNPVAGHSLMKQKSN